MATMTEIRPDETPAPAQQLRTYHGFLIALRYVVLAHVAVGAFLILAFCTNVNWLAALVIGVLILAAGLFFARDRSVPGWTSDAATLVMTTSAESGRHYRPETEPAYEPEARRPAE
jgi:hypothetical protein